MGQRESEQDLEEKQDLDYLRLQMCLQQNLGTSLKATQVLYLMDSTREPKKWSIYAKILFSLFTVYLLQFALYIADITTDSLVAHKYYTQWVTSNSSNDLCFLVDNEKINNITFNLTDYPDCLTSQSKFTYTMAFMILPILFYLIELGRNYKKLLPDYLKNEYAFGAIILLSMIFSPILALLWPGILFFWEAYGLVKYELKQGAERRTHKMCFDNIALMVLVVQLFEVCIESSFNAILQWYTILPQLISLFHDHFNENEELTYPDISSEELSFFFSVLSLAWSFTSYSAEQKDGALDITSNLVARLMLFLSNLLLIFARMNSLVLFMFFWGPGQFYPGMVVIFVHVVIMMSIHWYTLWKFVRKTGDIKTSDQFSYYLNMFYVCLLNGLANIFTNNFINVSIDKFKHIGKKKRKTFYRQVFGDLIFLVENVVMVSLGLSVDVKPLNDPITATCLGCAICACHLIGLLLKVLYYKYFHIWKDITVRATLHGFNIA